MIRARVRGDEDLGVELSADRPAVDRDLAHLRAVPRPDVRRAEKDLQADDDQRGDYQQGELPPTTDSRG